jgi:hypothetical protein
MNVQSMYVGVGVGMGVLPHFFTLYKNEQLHTLLTIQYVQYGWKFMASSKEDTETVMYST